MQFDTSLDISLWRKAIIEKTIAYNQIFNKEVL